MPRTNNTALVRLAPDVRDRLRAYCEDNGQSMGFVASKLVSDFLEFNEKNRTKKTARRIRVAKSRKRK